MRNMFYYKIKMYDCETVKRYTEKGILAAESFNDAVKIICEYYDSENILSLCVEPFGESLLAAKDLVDVLKETKD